MTCDKKFWLEDLGSLFCSVKVVPTNSMKLSQQMNAITRLVLILFVIMLLFNFKYSVHFLVISVVLIIILFYIQRRTMNTQEKYEGPSPYSYTSVDNLSSYRESPAIQQNGNSVTVHTSEVVPFCNDAVSIDPISDFATGMNQNLAGGAYGGKYRPNPKTLIAPVITPKSHDLGYWRENNLVTHSSINSAPVQQDMYASGYAVSNCCDYIPPGTQLVPRTGYGSEQHTENYRPGEIISPIPTQDRVRPFSENYTPGEIISPIPTQDRVRPFSENYKPPPGSIVSPIPTQDRVRPFSENYTDVSALYVKPNQSGWVNTSCGYDAQQVFDAGLPSNLAAGNCQKDPIMKQYNTNLHTQTVTPGVYTKNQVNEVINSNIGISYQQQFEPTKCHRDDNGLHYLQEDPRLSSPVDRVPEKPTVNQENIFDPRFYGYGTSYRSYQEPTTGQTRFAYDDVNAIRMPNYITRSKIDFLPYADTYGPIQEDSEYGNRLTPNIRWLAQDSWVRDSLQFRNDMTERLMRKNNSVAWQKRQYPLGPTLI